MRLEHIGIAVDDVEPVRRLYRELLGILPYKEELVEKQRVRTHFLNAGSAKLELLEATASDSPVAKHVERRGEGLHHLAFEVDDADRAFARLRDAGYTPLGDSPTRGADGKRIFFLHPKQTHGVLVEFCESAPSAPTPSFVPHRDGKLAVYTGGRPDAPPLLLLHGAAGCTALETAPLLRRLESSFRVIAVDFSGHGASTAAGSPVSFDRFTEDAFAVLDAHEVDVAHVFGFSMGGNVALDLARRHPGRVGRVTVHGACVSWTDALATSMQARLDADAIQDANPRVAAQLDAAHRDWPGLFGALHEWVGTLPGQTDAMHAMARQVTPPTLVSCVDRDDLFPVQAALDLHDLLVNARLQILPGTRHALPFAPLDQLSSALSGWM